MAESNTDHFGSSSFREVYKNTWLTKIPTQESKKKKERVWVVFCVHDDTQAYLESYIDNKAAILHKPDWFVCLNKTQHVSPTICAHQQEYEFVITLNTAIVRLAAPTWESMVDWVESLQSKLYELKILAAKENLYTKLPEVKTNAVLTTRDPTSPLPPTPLALRALPPGVELPSNSASTSTSQNVTTTYVRQHPILERVHSLPGDNERRIIIDNQNSDNVTVIQVNETTQHTTPQVFNFELNDIQESLPNVQEPPLEITNTHYERLFQLEQTPASSSRQSSRVQRTNSTPRSLQGPPPYVTLREQQVLQLQKEIKHPGGVRLQLRKKDCINSIALGDSQNAAWICGWKQKDHPMLYNALHIGDQLLSIEGVKVHSVSDALKILRSSYCNLYVNIIIKRVPFGQVFVIRRDVEGQPLGIVQEGNTAVVQKVLPGSLAAKHGLSSKAKSCDGLSFTNWVLTEINGRPLNLFFKENQVHDRLNSVGRDISILVQPLDLIKQLKKQLKALRNYKDYILQ